MKKDKFSVLKPFIYQLLLMSRKFVEIKVEHKTICIRSFADASSSSTT
jgi:hypothetical protein